MRTFFFTLLLVFTASAAQAQGCSSATKVFSDLNKKLVAVTKKYGCAATGKVYAGACLTAVSTYDKMSKEMVSYWNGHSRNWSTIGPRRIDFNKWQQGRIVSTGGRMFISAVPANKNTMTVDIKEIDGKGKTSYAVCKVDRYGNTVNLKTGWFNKEKKGKDNKRQSRSFTISGVKGYLVTIHFDGKSVGNTFQYQVRVK